MEGLSPEAVLEHRRATDLVPHATKQIAWAIGHSRAVMVAMERRLLLNILGIKEGEKSFPLNTPVYPSGLFGTAVDTVFKRFREARVQSAVLKKVNPLSCLVSFSSPAVWT